MNNLLVHHSLAAKEFWELALKETLEVVQMALKKHQSVRIGLAGGKTPKHLYEILADQKLPWDKFTFVVLDERMVPVDDPESNLGMLQNTLLSKTKGAKILAFDSSKTPQEAAKELARELIKLSDERQPIFDLLILGAGKDGHIASLFEDEETLVCSDYATPATAKGYPTESRVTVCLIALQSSSKALLLVQGEEKQAVLDSLKGKGTLKLTALNLLIEKMPLTVLTDLKA